MGTPYAGRHRPALSKPDVPTAAGVRHVSARTFRRPLLSVGAALVLVGASAATYAKAGDVMSGPAATLTVPAAATSQASESRADQLDQRDRKRAAASVAAQAAATAQAAELARLTAERQAAADRVARDAQRQAVVVSAQQDPRSVARSMLGTFGWSDSQWGCLEQLWTGESGWNYQAANASSDAYGIPQALPGSKMGTVAADYRTNPVTQITWGMQYVKATYGSPCAALGSWNSRSPHWY